MLRRAIALAVALLTTAPLTSAQECGWEQRPVSGPAFRAGAKMVYDEAREVVVLFGGGQPGPVWPGDTWEWNGDSWMQADTAGPGGGGGRIYHGLVYDTVREVTLMFGGAGRHGQFGNDLWQWDGDTWTPAPVGATLPPARNGAAMAFDSARGVVVLFGGLTEGSVRINDTWEYDGAEWREAATATRPPARLYSAMAYDAARGVTVLFGGNTPTYLDDTWEWDGSAWRRSAAAGPAGRAAQGMTYDPQRQAVVIFGGLAAGGVTYDDTWQFDGDVWMLIDGVGPDARYNAPIQHDAARGNIVLFGGLRAGPSWGDDTWILTCDGGCYADCDASGALDFFDFLCFQNAFAAAEPYADCDGSGSHDFFDFLCFQNEFAAGCP